MPSDQFLDGEIWYPLSPSSLLFPRNTKKVTWRFGRGTFQEVIKLARKLDVTEADCPKFKFMVFDIPNFKDPNATYAQRYQYLGTSSPHSQRNTTQHLSPTFIEEFVRDNPSKYMEVAPKVQCRDNLHLEAFFQDVLDKGGEGIILRDPYALYEPGRARGYIKHKVLLPLRALLSWLTFFFF